MQKKTHLILKIKSLPKTTKYPAITGFSPAVFDDEVLQNLSVKNVAEIENQAVRSDIPVLLISGEYDESTPVKWAEAMTNNLTNSTI